MKKWTSFLGQSSLLMGAASLAGFSLASCSVEVWNTNVQLVISPAGSKLADHSFTQSTWEGIYSFFKDEVYAGKSWTGPTPAKVIDKIGGIWRHPSGLDPLKFIECYRDAHASGADVLVCPGFEQAGPLAEFTSVDPQVIGRYPKWAQTLRDRLGVIYVDGFLTKSPSIDPYNVVSLAYKVDEAGFLGGVMMGIFLNLDNFYETVRVNFSDPKYQAKDVKPQPGTSWYNGPAYLVGSYVGLPIPPCLTYFNGLCSGMNFFNNNVKAIRDALNEYVFPEDRPWYPVTLISPNDTYKNLTMKNFDSGGFSPGSKTAQNLVDSFLQNKAAAILPVAGTQIALAVNEVLSNKTHTAILGNDSPQEDDPSVNQYQNDSAKHSVIPYSIKLNLGKSTKDTLNVIDQSILRDDYTYTNNGYHGFGYNNWTGYKNGAVGLSHGKLLYDSEKGKQSVLTSEILAKIEDIIGENYSTLKGDEFNQPRVAGFDSTQKDLENQKFSVLSAPQIGSSSGDPKLPNNIYAKPKDEEISQPIADVAKIQKFLRSLRDEIGVKNNKLGWYMRMS